MIRFTPKQRDTLLKVLINASNAVLGGLALGSVLGQSFQVRTFVVGLGLYIAVITVALLLER